MTAPRRRGRRDNGLDASSFRPLRDVDPRVGEHLLDVLREAGIAAYLDPTSDVDVVTRSIALPSPPSDRLFVDRSQSDSATTLLYDYEVNPFPAAAQAATTATSSTDDAQWRELVASYEAEHGRLGDILTEDLDQVAQEHAGARTAAPRAPDEAADDAFEEHYEPPPPPPLPILSKAAAYALVLVIGGGLLLVAPSLLGLSRQLGFVFGVLGIASGVAMLIWRMREGPQFEDPDDGAIV
ncbi:MAG: hypothetical protein M3400_09640 [Actinomycetota bacterium]|nr:hypothetical protein [Actinomycetota bacterium]